MSVKSVFFLNFAQLVYMCHKGAHISPHLDVYIPFYNIIIQT